MDDNFKTDWDSEDFKELQDYVPKKVRRLRLGDSDEWLNSPVTGENDENLEDGFWMSDVGNSITSQLGVEGDSPVEGIGMPSGESSEATTRDVGETPTGNQEMEVGLGSRLLDKAKGILKSGKKIAIALGILTSGWFIWTVLIIGILGGGLLAIIIPVIAGDMAEEFKQAGIDIGDFDLAGLDIDGISLEGITIGGIKETEVVTPGGGGSASISGSKEDFLAQNIGASYNVNEEKMIADFIASSVKAQSRLGSSVENVKKVMAIVKSNGMSPELFLAYELEEQGNYWGWLNHTSYVGDPYSDADSVSKWAVGQANSTGPVQLAWYDAAFPIYTTPAELQAKGQAFADALAPGSVGRMYLAGTAAATWGAFDPAALKGSVNGVQDYGDPIQGVMDRIQSWK